MLMIFVLMVLPSATMAVLATVFAVSDLNTRLLGLRLLSGVMAVAVGVSGLILFGEYFAGGRCQSAAWADDAPVAAGLEGGEAAEPAENLELEVEADAAADDAAELSVEPGLPMRIEYPADRPSWIDSPPEQIDGLDTISIEAGPSVTRRECRRAFEAEIAMATEEFIDDYLDSRLASKFIHYEPEEIAGRFLIDEYTYHGQFVSPSVGRMHESHALLVFDQSFRDELEQAWKDLVAKSRLAQTALVAVGILAFLGTAFSYFKLDTATRGFYTGRLQFAAVAAILTVIVAGALIARWIPWM